MASGDTKTQQYLDIAANGTRADLPSDNCCNTRTQSLIVGVAERIMDVEDEVEEIKNNPDVVDIVDTYADLQAYDTSTLTDKDIIRVLEDSTHNDSSTYYRWNASTNQFDYIGEAGGGVNVVQTIGTSTTDVMSQDATSKLVYPNSTATNKIGIGANVDVGVTTWYDAIAIGTGAKSTSQNTVAIGHLTKAQTSGSIAIGNSASAYNGTGEIAIGHGAGSTTSGSDYQISIGYSAGATKQNSIAIGRSATTSSNATSSVAIGYKAKATKKGQFDISAGTSGTDGYNNTNYRLITGVHDPQNANDAATKGYVDGLVGDVEAALNAINNGGN